MQSKKAKKKGSSDPSLFTAIWTLTKYMLKFYKSALVMFWLIDILISIVVLTNVSVSSKILDQITSLLSSPHVDLVKISYLILISTILGILYVGLMQWRAYLEASMSLKREIFHDSIIVKRLMSLHPSTYDDTDFIELKTRISWNLWKAFGSVYTFSGIIANIVSTFIYGIVVLKFSIPIFILITISIIPYYLISLKFGETTWSIWSQESEDKIKYAAYVSPLYTVSQPLFMELKILEYWKYLFKKSIKINQKFVNKFTRKEQQRFFYNFLENILEHILSAISVYIMVVKIIRQHLGVGQFYLLYTVLQRTKDSVYGVIYNTGQLTKDKGIIIDTYKLITYKSKMKNGTCKLPQDSHLNIEFKNVWFKYPRSKDWVLKDINLDIKFKDKIAIVGKNGAGKSTLLKLLLRVYDPTKGKILVNGVNLKEIDLASYYRFFGFLGQSVNIHGIKIKENIYFGNIHSKLDKHKIEKSVQLANIKDKIESLPKKYKTYINRELKNGVELSGGEKQKLAIARLCYRDPQIIILDEPTSAIDAIAEKKIFDNLFGTFTDRTMIIVSHRFSTIKVAKYIYVIENGTIIEKGSHKELMKQDGLYSKMYKTQMGLGKNL